MLGRFVYDELNDVLLAAESTLRAQGFTASALVAIKEYEWVVGFGRQGQEWVLYVAKNDTDATQVHVTKTSLELRCLAAHALPELLSALREAQRLQTEGVRQAIDAARRFVLETTR